MTGGFGRLPATGQAQAGSSRLRTIAVRTVGGSGKTHAVIWAVVLGRDETGGGW